MQIVKINQMEAEHHELVAQVFALDAVYLYNLHTLTSNRTDAVLP